MPFDDPIAYYNESDPYTAEWLRRLIKEGEIAPGVVDTRSISDVCPRDLEGFTQCHFFAGVGVWSRALRQAGWRDTTPVWTGSCPCQPFSAAGKGLGADDPRHLWPDWFWLIEQCRPETVFGEQVESKDGLAWLDLVESDMEEAAYAIGSVVTCAAGVGAPHIRHRLYFAAQDRRSAASGMGNGGFERLEVRECHSAIQSETLGPCTGQAFVRRSDVVELADPECEQWDRWGSGKEISEPASISGTERRSDAQRLADATSRAWPEHGVGSRQWRSTPADHAAGPGDFSQRREGPGPVNGFWRDADWLFCRDDKWRAVEPGTFPLAHGVAGRMGQLRAYGNALCLGQATAFVEAYMERDMVNLQETPAGDLFEWMP
ncbi:MAG: DNA cytosine methyltransferase [Paracoccaceae bacterium]